MAVIEVETVESVNNLEALAEWIPFGRLKSPFHLYVPAAMVDVAKRLCSDSHIPVAEIHTYHWIGDEMRFLPIYKAPAPDRAGRRSQDQLEAEGGVRKNIGRLCESFGTAGGRQETPGGAAR